MSDLDREYFVDRKTWKECLRRRKRIDQEHVPASELADYFTKPEGYRQFMRVYEPLRREIDFQGLKIVIEVAAGESDPYRQEPRRSPAPYSYGSIQNTIDRDLEPLDFFLGGNLDSDEVAVIDQLKPEGRFDEHKVLLGFRLDSVETAKTIYLANYQPGWKGFGGARLFTLDEFKMWMETYDPTKPAAKRKKALAESSGTAGGYLPDWSNIRCPACGGKMWCECSGRKSGDGNRSGVTDAGSATGDSRDVPHRSGGHGDPAPAQQEKEVVCASPNRPTEPSVLDRLPDRGSDRGGSYPSGPADNKEVAPDGAPFPEAKPGPQPGPSSWNTDSLDPDRFLPAAAGSGAGVAGGTNE